MILFYITVKEMEQNLSAIKILGRREKCEGESNDNSKGYGMTELSLFKL